MLKSARKKAGMSRIVGKTQVNRVQAGLRGYREQPEDNPYQSGTPEHAEYHRCYLIGRRRRTEAKEVEASGS